MLIVLPAVEQSVLEQGDEAVNLPGELVEVAARHGGLATEHGRGGPPMQLDIFPVDSFMIAVIAVFHPRPYFSQGDKIQVEQSTQ